MRALWKLAWLELKIFAREPLGLIGTLIVPAVVVLAFGRILGGATSTSGRLSSFVTVDLPVLGALLAAMNAVLSLVTIVSIYREGGILKRLRATPLTPTVILSAHVLVKIAMTVATLLVMLAAGRRFLTVQVDLRTLSFVAAVLVSLLCILSIGFLIASLVPTARFAQPVGGLILYPMLAVSGLFVPLAMLPDWAAAVARAVPLTYAVSLMRGIWMGDTWPAHLTDIAALLVFGIVLTMVSSRFFRWE